MFVNPLISNVIPTILRRKKQPFGQIEIVLRKSEGERGIATHRRETTTAVQKKNRKLKSAERKYFILNQMSILNFAIGSQSWMQLMLSNISYIH